jgi:O-methyltransferase involved in polyketide biosynthesis
VWVRSGLSDPALSTRLGALRRFLDLRYVETAGLRGPNHDVRPLDALASDGPASLSAVAAQLEHSRGLAIVTEGLLSYLTRDAGLALWRRVATTLGCFLHGFHFSDLHLARDVEGTWIPELFRVGLELFARGPVRHHFASTDETVAALHAAGFRDARLYQPCDVVPPDRPGRGRAHMIRVLAAAT